MPVARCHNADESCWNIPCPCLDCECEECGSLEWCPNPCPREDKEEIEW